jgi:uncharacterized Tic20 family protein
MTTNPSQPAPEQRVSGPVSSEPLDALPEPGKRAAAPSRDEPAAAEPGKPAAPEPDKGGQTQVITRERAEPAADPAGLPAADTNDHRLAMLSYLGVPFLGPVIPLGIYLTRRRASAFVRYHSAQALNLSITAMLALDSIVVALVVGVALAAALWLATLGYVILAGSRANRGHTYRIPGWLCATLVR